MSTIDDVTAAAATTEERSSMSRRNLLRLTMAGAGATAAGPVLARTGLLDSTQGEVQQGTVPGGVVSGSAPMVGPKVTKFDRELVVPPVIEPSETKTEKVMGKDATVHYYDVEQKVGYADLLPTPFPKTQIWGYNGIYPGPTFRQTQHGAYTVVRNTNTLPASTSTHLHSSPSQPAHDGHPDDQTWAANQKAPDKSEYDGGDCYHPTHTYRYPNGQETRTLWYHDHGMHHTATNVYKGLVGFFIQDPDDAAVAKFGLDKLPSGKYDVPLVVGDMQFKQDGTPGYDDGGHNSLWGNVVLVNGRAWPKMTVDRTRYRFRVLVADLSRGYNFQLSTGSKGSKAPTVTAIGTEAGLLTDTAVVPSWRQGMAERYEFVFDFSNLQDGETVTLKNLASDGDMGQIMQFVASGPVVPSAQVPAHLNDYKFGGEEKDVVNAKNPRHFLFERKNNEWVINGLPWDGRVAAAPKVGDTEIWVLENKSGGWFHPVHIHLVDFHIVRRNGGAPFAYEKGWKDVVFVGPNERVELVMKFKAADQIDPAKPIVGKYVMHCHNLIHEDNDMMTQFETKLPTGSSSAAVTAQNASMRGMSGHSAHGGDMNGHSMMVQWDLRA
jgi:FtsP/CotA-like multicopper oxidase with cupredoxin domain